MYGHQELNGIGNTSSVLAKLNQTDDMLALEMMNITGTFLHDLNEYCLLEIFSNLLLTPMDLCSLAETCKRFKEVTQRVSPKELGISRMTFTDGYDIQWKNYSMWHLRRDVERIVKNLGQNCHKLSMSGDQAIVDLVAKYCGHDSLKQLEICQTESIKDLCLKLKSIFQRLVRLSVKCCHIKNCPFLDINCDSLIELEIIDSGCVAILKSNFPNLERFNFHYYSSDEYNEDNTGPITKFIGRHRRLRFLQLSGVSVYYSCELLGAIANSGEELEELSLRDLKSGDISPNLFNLLSLPKLRKLEVSTWYKNVNSSSNYQISHLKPSSSLETVKLYVFAEIPLQLFDVLSQLQNLRELAFGYFSVNRIMPLTMPTKMPWTIPTQMPWKMPTQLRKLSLFGKDNGFCATDLINIIRQLINLEEFDCWSIGQFVLAEKDFNRIVKIVERRPNVLTLKCKYYDLSVVEKCDRKVRLINFSEVD